MTSLDYRTIVRKNLSIPTSSFGLITPQDVWNLDLPRLKSLYAEYFDKVKNSISEDELLAQLELDSEDKKTIKSPEQRQNDIRFELIKDVYKTKIQEKKDAKLKAKKEARIRQLREIQVNSQLKELQSLSPNDLEKLIKKEMEELNEDI